MPEQNVRFVGAIPETYDRHLGPVIFEPYATDLARRVAAARPAGPVLEIACGTGILTRQLRAALPSTTPLMATDLNEPMLDHARKKLDGATLLEWRQADAAALPFPSGSFAAVACQFGLMFVPDKAAAFREARRVLVEGGMFAFNVWDSLAYNSHARAAHETIASFFPSEPPAFFHIPFGFHDEGVLRQLLAAHGFGQVQLERVTLEARSSSAESFATGLVRGTPGSLAIQEQGLPFDPIVAAVTTALARIGGDKPFRASMQAVVVTARAGAD